MVKFGSMTKEEYENHEKVLDDLLEVVEKRHKGLDFRWKFSLIFCLAMGLVLAGAGTVWLK